jgi:alcohol dehydrogenase class IV
MHVEPDRLITSAATSATMNFEFATAAQIIFGRGKLSEIGMLAKQFGNRALVVTGNSPKRAGRLLDLLNASGVAASTLAIPGEPTLERIAEGVAFLKSRGGDVVIGFGGGSAIDAAKAIAALAANEGDVFDYLEVIGRGRPLLLPSIPFIAIPTTAGTGAEVTRNAVLASPEHRIKVSLRGPTLLPRVALVDSELTHDLPPALTASTGLDALTQLIEPYVSIRANPVTDALCLDGVRRVVRSLRRAFANVGDAAAREDMALASLFGGLALANAGLGAVHGFAAPIGGMFPAPHGAVCAALLPEVMEANLRALRSRIHDSEVTGRYEVIAQLLTGNSKATAEDGVRSVRELCQDLSIEKLTVFGITRDDIPSIIERAAKASSMKANPLVLTAEELAEILAAAV